MNDVTAAIESDLAHARETWAVGRGVFNTETDATYIDRILAALPTLLAEVERLCGEVATIPTLLDEQAEVHREIERLRAEREAVSALHFETEGVHTHTVCAHRYCVDDSHDQHQWPCPTAIAAGLVTA